MIRHANLLARWDAHGWRGALIEGASGAGKSDLALRALDAGWRLVADDRTLVWRSGAALYGRAPDPLAGLIETRGLGVIGLPSRAFVQIGLLARCVQDEPIERSPDDASETVLGVALPLFSLAALEVSAHVKLGHALTHIGLKPQPAYLACAPAIIRPAQGGDPLRVKA